jgi:hypothetical protein
MGVRSHSILRSIDEKFKKLALISCYNIRNKKIEK